MQALHRTFSMLMTLDRTSRQPLGVQIRMHIQDLLERGALRAGEALPSTRVLAEQLGVHRTTVAEAYRVLGALGWVDLEPGLRARVRARMVDFRPEAVPAAGAGLDWGAALPASVRAQAARGGPAPEPASDMISFLPLTVDPRLMPVEGFRGCVNRALRRHGAALLGYGPREGYRPLRDYLARRLATHGIRARPEEILLTHGSQQALDLVLRMLGPGRTVALENPTYGQAAPLLDLAGQRALPLPMGRDGLDLDALEACLARERPDLLYTMPNFQNPTGTSTSQAHRERLLALCARAGVPILEDGFEEEMKYFGRVALPIKAMDREGRVLYCGTFSKVLLPGVRIGWVVAPEPCIQVLAGLRRVSELCPEQVLAAALHDFCAGGLYDRHLARMHRVFRSRMRAALKALRACIPPGRARWEEPAGGYLIWLELAGPPGLDWVSHCAAHGVAVSPGAEFYLGPAPAAGLRLSIAALDEAEIREGIRRLGLALAAAPRSGVLP